MVSFLTHTRINARRAVTAVTMVCLLAAVSAFAQTSKSYKIEQVVSEGKKSVETDAVLEFNSDSFSVTPDKKSFKSEGKTLRYTDLKTADYSYSKKPMLSGGGAVATALLVGFIFALPFLFIKKKNHWMTVQTADQFAVLKLDGSNYRQIVSEFETHGVPVKTVEEEKKK